MSPEAQAILSRADDGRLASCLSAVRALEAGDFPWPARARARILRNFTAEPLSAPLRLSAFRRGIRLDVSLSDYDAYAPEILDPASGLEESGADLAVLALWLGELRLAQGEGGALDAARVIDHVEGLAERLLARGPRRVALNTMLLPRHRLATAKDEIALARINLAILSLAERHGHDRVVAVDLRRLVEELGEAQALDARGAFPHRAPVAPALAARRAEALADAIAAAHGAGRKVLALDCDGTLWGGVVGEDGLEGIGLSSNDYPGSAFVAFQEQVIALQRAGVLLALCSKNEEADVLAVLDGHPACRVKRSHVAARRISWASKVESLRSIAAELNVGLDSFVFVDDSAFECAMVREALPMVDVRRVPERACDLPALLAGAFATSALTAEDRARTESMQAERRRAEASREAPSVEAFLTSLDLVARVGPPDAGAIARVAQLTQRTNQWNLTTRRYGADEIARLAADPDAVLLALEAADRFGAYGLVGVAIARREGAEARIETLLLSCRALGRRLEDVLLAELLAAVTRRFGPVAVRAEYLATEKNAQVARFFDGRGFTLVEESASRRAYLGASEALCFEVPTFIRRRP